MKALSEAFEVYLTLIGEDTRRRFRSLWKEWIAFIGRRARGATAWDGLRYLTFIRSLPGQAPRDPGLPSTAGSGTVRLKVELLHALYAFFMRHGLISTNPFEEAMRGMPPREELPKRPTEGITDDGVCQLLEVCASESPEDLRNRAFLAVLIGGGLRRAEASRLRVRDVNVSRNLGVLTLTRTKARRPAEQLLPEWATIDVRRYLVQRDREHCTEMDPFLVGYPDGTKMDPRRLYRLFLRLAKLAGLPGHPTPHSCRATSITKLLDAGVDLLTVRKFARLSSFTMVGRYDKRRDQVELALRALKFTRKRLHRTNK